MVTELARLTRSAAELGGSSSGSLGPRCDWSCSTSASTPAPTADGSRHAHDHGRRLGARAPGRAHPQGPRRGACARGGEPSRRRDRPELVEQITTMRASGMTLQAIADALNDQGQPTVRGGARWRPSSVQTALGYKRRRARPGHKGQRPNGQDEHRDQRPRAKEDD